MPERAAVPWEEAHPDLDTSSMEIVGPLKAAAAALDLVLEPLFESAPVTPPELDVLLKLRITPQPVIAVVLARWLGRSGAAISKTLAKLERRGLVAREPNPADRRAALVRITGTGVEVVDDLIPRQLALEARALAALTPGQRDEIANALATLNGVLRAAAQGRSTEPPP
jgi:DNA-binding MarR family transcriptional regulator